jgi:eukaryotic-like serine/threonine-protein kinase
MAMHTHKLIARLSRETPAELKTSARWVRTLPDDLLRQASRRVEIISLIGAALWFLGPALGHLAFHATNPEDPRWLQFWPMDAIALVSIAVSLGLYLYLRAGDRDPARVMDLALGYMVFVALAIGVMSHLGSPSPTPSAGSPTITWTGPVVLMFAAIVPALPKRFLVAGFIAVSMVPVGMILGKLAGAYHFGSWGNVLAMHYPDYLLLGVAVVISLVVTGLGQQVTKERELGSYRLGELLGRGGMGEVYLATHRMLARPAAIKLLRPEMLAGGDGTKGQLAVVRFRREAEAAAKLRSPHTVELYDFGVTQDGILFLVMELLHGVDLETLVRRHGPLPSPRVVHLLRQVCESLEEAHISGLVHRDIKPANIHVGRVGLHYDFVKVLDFGLVKSVVAGAGEGDSLASAAGLTPGTPTYMSPEMAHGESIDGRADLYSLGCVAYFLLTGSLVFQADTAIGVILKHIEQPPVPPSKRTDLPIPPALEKLVLACLAKRPADRPQSAAELARALSAVETDSWGEEQAVEWWRANELEEARIG